MHNIHTLAQAETFLEQHKPKTFASRMTGDYGVERIQYFLKMLGSPQNKLRVVHIAGTAGKGSVAFLTSTMLRACGFKVGLTVSPHLFDIRERVQINNELLSEEKFVRYLNDLVPHIGQFNSHYQKPLTYFEIMMALAYYAFYAEGVDYAVIETGLGGRFDASNCVDNPNKLCIITRIGLDHQHVLGNTIPEIAWQKAGIVRPHNTVVALGQPATTMAPIRQEAELQAAGLHVITAGKEYRSVRSGRDGTTFDFAFASLRLERLHIGLAGAFQAQNASLALAGVVLLSERDSLAIPVHAIRAALADCRFFGRLSSLRVAGKEVIFDGAHNPLEMKQLAASLRALHPRTSFDFLIAYKQDTDYQKFLEYIAPIARSITVTSLTSRTMDLATREFSPGADLAAMFQQSDYHRYRIVADQREALLQCLADTQHPLVVTASLYLLAPIYELCKQLEQAA